MVKLVIDSTHRDDIDLFHEKKGLRTLADSMIDEGIEFSLISDDFIASLEALPDRSALMLYVPSREFSEDEISALNEFVSSGGGLLILGEWGNMDNSSDIINRVLRALGMPEYFNFDRVVDEYNIALKKAGVPEKDHIVVRDFGEHPITSGIREVGYYSGCSIDAPHEKALMWSSEMSFSDLDGDLEFDDVEIFGEKILAFWERAGDGRVVGIGDSSLVQNEYIGMYDNLRFMRNVILWIFKTI